MRRLFVLTIALVAITASAYAQYNFIYPIDYPGADWSAPLSINNRGDIAGSYFKGERNYAFTLKQGKFATLKQIEPNVVWDLNNHGDMVGNTDTASSPTPTPAFLLSKGVLTLLAFPGADVTFANGISEPGTVVGYYKLLAADGSLLAIHGYIWKDGIFSEYMYPGSADTVLAASNAQGDVLGSWDPDINGFISHGFVCSAQGKCTSFDVPFPGGFYTGANHFNAQGDIVGGYFDESFMVRGFLLVKGEYEKFDVPGSIQTYPTGINDVGQIVGWYTGSDLVLHGFVAQPENKGKKPGQ